MQTFLRKLNVFRISSLQGRLFALLGICAAIAVLTTGGTAAYLNLRANKASVREGLLRETEILSQFSEVVLAFEGLGSPDDLKPSFKALSRDRHVMAMVVYSADGRVFASYTRPDVTGFTPPPFTTNGLSANELWMDCQLTVQSGNRVVGGVFLRHDTEEIRERFADFVESGLVAAAISFAAALLLAGLLGRFISRPVEQLAAIASQIGESRNFSLRATRTSNDEIGRLVDQFNGMLGQIESQNRELQKAHDELEDRVELRTRELAQSENYLRSTLNGIPIPVAIYLTDGTIDYLNSNFTATLDFDVPDLPDIDSWWNKAFPDESDRERVREEWAKQVADALESDGIILPYDAKITTKRGKQLEVTIWGRVMGDRIVVLVNDVTQERKRQEDLARARDEAEAANRAKSQFLSRMSHELRTPLNGIIGFSKILEMASLPERQEKNVKRIHEAGLHLLDLINEVLDISRIEAGEFSISPEGVEVGDVIREVVDLVEPMARDRQIRIVIPPDGSTQLRASADRQRLRQVLLNLASNAIKYNHDEGRVTFSTSRTASGRVRIELTDTGMGIPEEKISRLFIPFDRLDAERTHTQIEGTGLGLSLSKKLIEVMGGAITVSSKVGEGSTFTVELDPSEPAPATQAPIRQADAQSTGSTSATKEDPGDDLTILYIEDNPDNLALVEQVVEHSPGVRLITAIQGGQGLDLARVHQPDLIFLDFHLPDLNGDEVLIRLKRNDGTRDIPVIMLSADAMTAQIKRLKDLGASDYLTKPLDVERFLELLSSKGRERRQTVPPK